MTALLDSRDVQPDWEKDLLNEIALIHILDECELHKGIARDGELAEGACGAIFVFKSDKIGHYCKDCLEVPVRHARCWVCHKEVIS